MKNNIFSNKLDVHFLNCFSFRWKDKKNSAQKLIVNEFEEEIEDTFIDGVDNKKIPLIWGLLILISFSSFFWYLIYTAFIFLFKK